MKKLFILLSIFTIVGPGAAYHKVYLFHVLLLLIFINYILNLFKENKIKISDFSNQSIRFWLVFLLWNMFSLVWSIEFGYTIQYLFYIGNGILLIYLISIYISDLNKLTDLIKVLLITGSTEISISLLEIFTSFRYPLSPFSKYSVVFGYNGFDETMYSERALNYLEITPTGFMGNPNDLAIVLTLILPYFLIIKNKKIAIIISLLILLVIFYTGSRGGLITAVIILLAFLGTINLARLLRYIFVLPFIGLFIILFFNFATQSNNLKLQELIAIPQTVINYISFEKIGNDDSIGVRQTLIVNGIEALKDSYFLGVGGGASKKVQELNGSDITSMHNFWIELLVENGVLLFTCFVFWYFYLLNGLLKIFKSTKSNNEIRRIAGATALSLFGFIPGAISASSTIYLLPMWFVFGVAISILKLSKLKGELTQ